MSRIVDQDTTRWPFVNTTIAYDIVDSTSDRAAELVREGRCTLPLLVWARKQTQGRGRGTHEWWSDAGSLTLTLAIDPLVHGLTVENEPKLALATAVAVIEALNELELGSPSLGIRWPNDLEVEGRKLGGILPEHLETPHGHRILVGIGLNVQTNLAAAPARGPRDGDLIGRSSTPSLSTGQSRNDSYRRFSVISSRCCNVWPWSNRHSPAGGADSTCFAKSGCALTSAPITLPDGGKASTITGPSAWMTAKKRTASSADE